MGVLRASFFLLWGRTLFYAGLRLSKGETLVKQIINGMGSLADRWTHRHRAKRGLGLKRAFEIPLLVLTFVVLAGGIAVRAQEKGVDTQNERIRDAGTERAPGNNGAKTNVGAGRGIDFGKGRTPPTVELPNPYRFAARRDAVINAIQEVMRERRLTLDTAASKPDEGLFITQPYTFAKGSIVATSELSRYAEIIDTPGTGWTRGRYVLIIEVQPVDGNSTNVAVNARIEGRSDGISGAEWVRLRSTGAAEQEFLRALVEKLASGPPNATTP